jgi:hypothetical protein
VTIAVKGVPTLLSRDLASYIGLGKFGPGRGREGECETIRFGHPLPGNEDAVLGRALYREIMGVFRRRIDERRNSLFV